MTAFVRSVFPKRNPRNVPLDLFDTGGSAPYPYPFEDSSLSQEEKARRWEAIQKHRAELDRTLVERGVKASEEYKAIFGEIVRAIGEKLRRIRGSGLIEAPKGASEWRKLGSDLASTARDLIAAFFAAGIFEGSLYYPGKKVQSTIGRTTPKDFTLKQLQDEYERRAVLLERWIAAKAAFEARPEVLGGRALHGSTSGNTQRFVDEALHHADKLQADVYSHGAYNSANLLFELRDRFAKTLGVLRDNELVDAMDRFDMIPARSLEAMVKKREALAAKGAPRASRKLALAAQENPFAGFRTFRDCVRAKSKDPRNYSPAGLCATIERKAHQNPGALTAFGSALLTR